MGKEHTPETKTLLKDSPINRTFINTVGNDVSNIVIWQLCTCTFKHHAAHSSFIHNALFIDVKPHHCENTNLIQLRV